MGNTVHFPDRRVFTFIFSKATFNRSLNSYLPTLRHGLGSESYAGGSPSRGAMKSQRLASSQRSAASSISAGDSSRSTSRHSRMKAWRASSSVGKLA